MDTTMAIITKKDTAWASFRDRAKRAQEVLSQAREQDRVSEAAAVQGVVDYTFFYQEVEEALHIAKITRDERYVRV